MSSIIHNYADIAARLQHSDMFRKPAEKKQAPPVSDPNVIPVCPTCGNPDKNNYIFDRFHKKQWGCRSCNKWI